MAARSPLALVLAASLCGTLLSACATGGALRNRAAEVQEDVDLARERGAQQCAPVALATGESHLAFAREELRQGDASRAERHLDVARDAAREAVRESQDCLEPPAPSDLDGDGIPDSDDVCPEEPEDSDGFQDDDGCPDPDNDLDEVPDVEDRCPTVAGPVANQGCPYAGPLDGDADGVPDETDRCPSEPEDADGFQDEDGCPDPDNDGDGILDVDDRCPDEPGPADREGCPLRDRDGDGIGDNTDACPDEPEDMDGYEDADGCPDLDNDGDGIPDIRDECPMDAGPPENEGCPATDRDRDGVADHLDACPDEPGVAEERGCPRKYSLVELKKDRIEIRQKVHFETGKWRILPDSYALLDQVAQVLDDNPNVRIRIEGHTDSRGSDAFNLRLSQRRADAVRAYLVRQGIDPPRMEAVGFGETRPIASNATSVGREENRRVEFVVTER